MLFGTSIGIGCPNDGAQFNKCSLQGCAKYASISLLQYLHVIRYTAVDEYIDLYTFGLHSTVPYIVWFFIYVASFIKFQ